MWNSPRLELARHGWMPWLLQEARVLPHLAMLAAWLLSVRFAGLLPLALVHAGEETQAERLLYRLYGIYLAVLLACRAAGGGGGGRAERGRGVQCVRPGTWAGLGVAPRVRMGATGERPAASNPGEGPPDVAARSAGGVAVGARLCRGPGALGLGPPMDSGLQPCHLRGAGPRL